MSLETPLGGYRLKPVYTSLDRTSTPSVGIRRLWRGDLRSWMVLLNATLICLNLLILSHPGFFTRFTSSIFTAYLFGTVALIAINVGLLLLPLEEDDGDYPAPRQTGKPWMALLVLVCGLSLLAVGSYRWLQRTFTFPIDSTLADMLVIIQEGIKSLLQGKNPYGFHYIPWKIVLPYGPPLWMPYILPHIIGFDLRFLTIAASLFIGAVFGAAATMMAREKKWVWVLGLLAVEAAFCLNRALYQLIPIVHTPVYWPLILLFCYLFSQRRLGPAAVTLGFLVAARISMVALVPVFFIYAIRGHLEAHSLSAESNAPKHSVSRLFLYFSLAALLPFLPFAILNFQTLSYGLYAQHSLAMKRFTWTDPVRIFQTFGTTGFFISRGWHNYVEWFQLAVLLVFYALAWFRIKFRMQAMRWMAVALLIFSMTTLWPVLYLYLDVFVLLGAAYVVNPGVLGNRLARFRLVPLLTGAVFAAVLVLYVTANLRAGNFYTLDVGTAQARQHLASGFSKDESDRSSTFAWVTTTSAVIRLPRLSRSPANIVIFGHPFSVDTEPAQTMTAFLNGRPIGTKELSPAYGPVSFVAPSEVWRIGFNQLELRFRYARSPKSLRLSDDPRPLAYALDKVVIARPDGR